jgi:transposase InsO family protein
LKVKRLHGRRLKTRRDAKDEIVDWLLWYKRARLHSTLAYTSPMHFEVRIPGARSDLVCPHKYQAGRRR